MNSAVGENPHSHELQIANITKEIQRSNRALESEDLRQSLYSFLNTVLDIYKLEHGKGKDIVDISMDFDSLTFNHSIGAIELPKGTTAVQLVSTGELGADDTRLWNSTFLVREASGSHSVYGGRLDSYIAGQNENGEWEVVGSFESLLDEDPKERIIRTIHEQWERDSVWEDENKSQVAAEVILLNSFINNPREFGDLANGAIESLFRARVKQSISPSDNVDAFKAMSEFNLAKKALAYYLQFHEKGIETAIKNAVLRKGTGFFSYELDVDPIEQKRLERGYRTMIEISASDIDRFAEKRDVPLLEE